MNRARPFLYVFLTLAGFLGGMESAGPADPNGHLTTGVSTGGGGGGTGTGRQVTVSAHAFTPASITIAVNDTVTWVWSGTNSHSVTFDDGHDSGAKTTGSYQRFFGTAGTFSYHSSVLADSLMTGAVIV